jgi:hypothetical protein
MQSGFPPDWHSLPPIIQLHPGAAPFSAYRTFSVLDARFLPIEHAVRTILSQVDVEQAVRAELTQRLQRERLILSPEVVERIEYAFTGASWKSGDQARSVTKG